MLWAFVFLLGKETLCSTPGTFFKSWNISYPLISFSLSKTSKLPFCIVYNPYQDEDMKKTLFRLLLLSPSDLWLSYQPTQVPSWSGHTLVHRFKQKCVRASQKSGFSPVSPHPKFQRWRQKICTFGYSSNQHSSGSSWLQMEISL